MEIHECISQLYYYGNHDLKQHEELCLQLYKYDLEKVEFYLPQLCSMLVNLKDRSSTLAEFILEQSSKSMHFALKTALLLRTLLGDNIEHHFHDLEHKCIKAAITGKRPMLVDQCSIDDDDEESDQDGEYELEKSKRFRYLRSMQSFIRDISSIEDNLLQIGRAHV